MKAGILLFDGVDEMDVIGPARPLWALDDVRPFVPSLPEVRVTLVSESAGPVVCGNGTVLVTDSDYASASDLRVLIVPGGAGDGDTTGRVRQQTHEPTLSFIRDTARRADIVASVCTGAFLLAGAGLLAGRRANTHWYNRQELLDFMRSRGEGLTLVPERVVDDGPVVTAGGVLSGIDLGFHLVERLFGTEVRDGVELAVEATTPTALPELPARQPAAT